jgi:hypothetical protein
MKRFDTTQAIYDGLGELRWQSYLRAMSGIAEELISAWHELLPNDVRGLAAETRDLAGRAAVANVGTAEIALEAGELHRRWGRVISAEAKGRQAGPARSLVHLYYVLRDLAGEICGTRPRYQAREVLDVAATEPWIDGSDGRLPAWVNSPNAELDDGEPVAQALLRLKRIVDQAVAEERSNSPKLGDLLNWHVPR